MDLVGVKDHICAIVVHWLHTYVHMWKFLIDDRMIETRRTLVTQR